MTKQQQKIIAAYARNGIEAVAGKGGFWLKDGGFRTTRQAQADTNVAPVARISRPRVSAYGDLAWLQLLNSAQ